ncbi:hypothetical protein DPMN_084065 [Dreissena polymorpha]|uniref:Uncharacterized protein n=1 Tax=Dreissena polymorpha TaxID=45954 RepID=A0A9D3YE66_DREPO|nr:hypothetical protein DPMN_084065 [Dreissena polymorpha]
MPAAGCVQEAAANKSEFELSTLQREKERDKERDSLREVNEELKCRQLHHVGAGDDLRQTRQMEMLSLPNKPNQKIMELEARIEDLQEMTKATVSSNELAELRKKLDEQTASFRMSATLKSHGEGIRRLREDVDRKEEEKRYFDKARAEAKLKSTGSFYPEVQTLKQQLSEKNQQLQEKDKIIEQLNVLTIIDKCKIFADTVLFHIRLIESP